MPCTPPCFLPSPLTLTAPHSGAFSSVHSCLLFLPHSEYLSRPFFYAVWGMWVRSLGQEDPLEEEMATHSSILAWRIPWTGEPGRLLSMGVTKNQTRLSNLTLSPIALFTHYRYSSWAHPFPQFLPPSWAFTTSPQFLRKLNRVNKNHLKTFKMYLPANLWAKLKPRKDTPFLSRDFTSFAFSLRKLTGQAEVYGIHSQWRGMEDPAEWSPSAWTVHSLSSQTPPRSPDSSP